MRKAAGLRLAYTLYYCITEWKQVERRFGMDVLTVKLRALLMDLQHCFTCMFEDGEVAIRLLQCV